MTVQTKHLFTQFPGTSAGQFRMFTTDCSVVVHYCIQKHPTDEMFVFRDGLYSQQAVQTHYSRKTFDKKKTVWFERLKLNKK